MPIFIELKIRPFCVKLSREHADCKIMERIKLTFDFNRAKI